MEMTIWYMDTHYGWYITESLSIINASLTVHYIHRGEKYIYKFDTGSGLAVLWRTTSTVSQAFPDWSQTLDLELWIGPRKEDCFSWCKTGTHTFIVVASKRERILYRAGLLFFSCSFASLQCQNKGVTEPCYNSVACPMPRTFQAMPKNFPSEGIEENTSAKLIPMLLLPLDASCLRSPWQIPALLSLHSLPMNTHWFIQLHMALSDTRKTNLMHI